MTSPKTCQECRLKSVETTKAYWKRINNGFNTPYICAKCLLGKPKPRKPRKIIAIKEDVPAHIIKFETNLLGISKSIWLRKRAPFKRRYLDGKCNEKDLQFLKHPSFHILKISLEKNEICCSLLMRHLKITALEAKQILGDL